MTMRSSAMRTRLAKLREDRHLSQTTLASLAGLTQSGYSKIERGEPTSPETLARIAAALECSVDEIAQVDEPATRVDPRGVPTMAGVPGWAGVLERAKAIAPEVDADSWVLLEHSPGLLSSDLPLTPAVVADLARVVMRHAPAMRKR